METATLRARLMAVLSSFGAVVMLAPVASADFAGGGSAKSDCYVVFQGIDSNKVSCTEGDPACDSDGCGNNTCTFSLTACTNGTGCSAVSLDSITSTPAINTPTTPTSDAACADESSVPVTLKAKKNGDPKKAKVKLTVIATAAAGTKPKKDKDKISFTCLPRTDACPPTTTTSSTTSTTVNTCCELPGSPGTAATFLGFATTQGSGQCGTYFDNGMVKPIACGGLYFGGGGNAVPLPGTVPDQGNAVSKIVSCDLSTNTATVGGATSAETGNPLNCTAAGCIFGAPLAVPNTGSTPTSTCVVNAIASGISGTVSCASGASDLSAPLSSIIFLTGDTATDPTASITGIQPCPLCSGSTCIGGPNNGMACTAGTSALGGNTAYPTSHDCPPDPMFNIGTLPIAFSLTTGTVSWTATTATNDTGSTVSVGQMFTGFCRDKDGTGAFEGTTPQTAHQCWENGMAVGAACSGVFESCEQRNKGCFGPNGGACTTITAIGSASGGLTGGPAAATLVSIFTIPPTFNGQVDAAGDLPGPGAVALPGTARLCGNAMACP